MMQHQPQASDNDSVTPPWRPTSPFTDEHLETWRREGLVIVEGYLDKAEIEFGVEGLRRITPTWEQYRDERENWPTVKPLTFLDFPFKAQELNHLTLNPHLLDFAEKALGTKDLVLAHSEILAKYADTADFDQPMHMDYLNNTFVVPPPDDIDQLASITYYTDITIDLGPTRVVPWSESEDYHHQVFWSREEGPELYARERAVTVPAGSIVLYTMRTFHRGSAFTATEGSRYSHHIAFQRRSSTWAGWRNYPALADKPRVQSLMTQLDARQRAVVGFPAVDDPYWTPWTIEAVQKRYPAMDMAPYRAALADRSA